MAIRLDKNFGHGGFVPPTSTLVRNLSDLRVGLVRLHNGHLVAGGTAQMPDGEHFYLARYQENGTPEGETLSTLFARGWALAIQPTPRLPRPPFPPPRTTPEMLLIGGTIDDPTHPGYPNNVFGVQRYSERGDLDTHFGDGGIAWLDVVPRLGPADLANDEHLWALAVQPGKGILAAGQAKLLSGTRGALVRWQADGKLDKTFGRGQHGLEAGRVVYPPLDAPVDSQGQVTPTSFNAIAVQPDGKIVIGGRYGGQILVARFTADGAFDSHFGQDGRVSIELGLGAAGDPAILLQPDGKIVVACTVPAPTGSGGSSAIGLTRRLANGSFDQGFGELISGSFGSPADRHGGDILHTTGRTIQSIPGLEWVATAIPKVGDPLVGIIGLGTTQTSTRPSRRHFLVTTYSADGQIGELNETAFPTGSGGAGAGVYDPGSKTLTVAGNVYDSARQQGGFGLARYLWE